MKAVLFLIFTLCCCQSFAQSEFALPSIVPIACNWAHRHRLRFPQISSAITMVVQELMRPRCCRRHSNRPTVPTTRTSELGSHQRETFGSWIPTLIWKVRIRLRRITMGKRSQFGSRVMHLTLRWNRSRMIARLWTINLKIVHRCAKILVRVKWRFHYSCNLQDLYI